MSGRLTMAAHMESILTINDPQNKTFGWTVLWAPSRLGKAVAAAVNMAMS
jgi:hypothetical protein